jgi:hypothetical protein
MATISVFIFLAGCGDNDEENPPPASPPSAAGTYYGMTNLSGGESQMENRVKLHLQQSSSSSLGGSSPLYSPNATSESLTGYVSYGDSTYVVSGSTHDDSLGISWTTALGAWFFQGTFDA